MDPNNQPETNPEQQQPKGIETIPCPNCGVVNSILRDECESCGADLSVAKNILNNANRHYNTALQMAKAGRNDEAIVELQAAIELWGKNPHYFNLLGTVYARKGVYDQAVKAWEQTLALDPNFEKAYQSISKARKVQLHVAEETRQRPYKMMVAGAVIVAVAALVALIFVGIRASSAGSEVERLSAKLGERPTKSDVIALEEKLEVKDSTIADLREFLGKSEAENELKDQRIAELEERNRRLENRPIATEPAGTEQRQEETGAKLNQLQSQVAQLEQQKAGLQNELDQEKTRKEALAEQLEGVQSDLQNARTARQSLEAELKEADTQVASLKEQAEQAQSKLQSLQEESVLIKKAFQEYQEGRYRAMLGTLIPLDDPELIPSQLVAMLRKEGAEQVKMLEDPLYKARMEAAAEEARRRELAEREYYAGLKVEKARPVLEQEQYEEAIPILKEAIEILPESEEARQLLEEAQRQLQIAELSTKARAAEEAGLVEQALVFYRQWLKVEPENREVERTIRQIERQERDRLEGFNRWMQSGAEQIVRGDFQQAIEDFEQAVQLARLPEEKSLASESLFDARQRRQERLEIEARLAADLEAALQAADAYYQQEQYDEALVEVQKALKVDPTSREARRLSNLIERAVEDELRRKIGILEGEARHLEDSKQYKAMIETYRKILELDPDHRGAQRALEQWEEQEG